MASESKAVAMALVAEAEAEAAAADALAAAARARARAARLRREALGLDGTGEEVREPARRWTRMPWVSKLAKLVAIIVILGFAGTSGYLVWDHRETTRQQQRIAAFAAGAKQGIINLTSLDFNRAKEDVQRVIDSSTGAFRDQIQERATDFIKVVQESKSITEGTVNGIAVESMAAHSAKVLVCATSRVTNKPDSSKDEPRTWRLKVTMDDDGGQYKMAKVEFVP